MKPGLEAKFEKSNFEVFYSIYFKKSLNREKTRLGSTTLFGNPKDKEFILAELAKKIEIDWKSTLSISYLLSPEIVRKLEAANELVENFRSGVAGGTKMLKLKIGAG